jgi:RHS repeat-associated protein
MIFDKTGSLAGTKRHDYLPFGEELYANVGIRSTTLGYTAAGNTPADKVRQKFTEQERDDETGLDYMHARYFANVQGRFMSVDPLQASARPGNLQSWNRYSYALNNPLRYSDPSGLTTSGAYSGDMDGPGVGNPQDSDDEERRREELLAQETEDEAAHTDTGGHDDNATADDAEHNHAGDSGSQADTQNVLLTSASLAVGLESIPGTTTDYQATFALTTDSQMQEVFGGSTIQVQLKLFLPDNVASMTPTSGTTVPAANPHDIKRALEEKKPGKSTATEISGSQARLPDNSNFIAASHPEGHPGIASVSFGQIKDRAVTATFTLFAHDDRKTNSNSFYVRIEGRTDKGRLFRKSIQVMINPKSSGN